MNLENLTLREGVTYQAVVQTLNEAGIIFRTETSPHQSETHFRDSRIRVLPGHEQQVMELFGNARRRAFHTHWYYAKYEIGEDFDRNTISGKVKMVDGMLVEKVGIQFWEY